MHVDERGASHYGVAHNDGADCALTEVEPVRCSAPYPIPERIVITELGKDIARRTTEVPAATGGVGAPSPALAVCGFDSALASGARPPTVREGDATSGARAYPECALLLLKPDVLHRRLVSEVLGRVERLPLQLLDLRLVWPTAGQVTRHYAALAEKPFFDALLKYMTSGPLIAAAVSGPNAVAVLRKLAGATDPAEAAPGTIRGDLAASVEANLVHVSASAAEARREALIWLA
jgi:nucleoside-diphosphate kinase